MIDFNNDALEKIPESLTPLIGSGVRVYGCFPDGRDYTFGTLFEVHKADGGAYIDIDEGNHKGIIRLHAFQEVHRLLIDD